MKQKLLSLRTLRRMDAQARGEASKALLPPRSNWNESRRWGDARNSPMTCASSSWTCSPPPAALVVFAENDSVEASSKTNRNRGERLLRSPT